MLDQTRNTTLQMQLSPSLRDRINDSERMLTALINNLHGVVYCCLYDMDWTMVFFGKGSEELTGYSAQEFLGDTDVTFESITHIDDRKRVRDIIDNAVVTRQRFVAEYRIIHADGEIRWLIERGCPIYNDSGEVEAIEGFLQDITPRKLSEIAAIDAEERYRSIFENAVEGIYQTSPDGQYLDINPALVKIYGYKAASDLRNGITDIDGQLYVE